MLFCFIKSTYRHSFLNIGPFFYYFHPFLILTTNAVSFSAISIEKSIDSVLGIRTCGRWIVCAVETTEPWRPPSLPPTYIVEAQTKTILDRQLTLQLLRWKSIQLFPFVSDQSDARIIA